MTTPPLDLPAERLTALREVANAATQDFWWHDLVGAPGQRPEDKEWAVDSNPTFICSTQIGTKRGEQDARHIAAFDPPTVLALLDRLEAAERDLAAVTVSRDGWKTRAEAAEKKVAAVEALHTKDDRECAICRDAYGDYVHYPCPTITALDTHTPETETTP